MRRTPGHPLHDEVPQALLADHLADLDDLVALHDGSEGALDSARAELYAKLLEAPDDSLAEPGKRIGY